MKRSFHERSDGRSAGSDNGLSSKARKRGTRLSMAALIRDIRRLITADVRHHRTSLSHVI